jgi:type IV pilus assembly protein PilW
MLKKTGQRGLSLVELMVGIAIGLFIVAAASLVMTAQLGDNRRLLLETQLQQDLRASADIIARELRRAGSTGNTNLAQQGAWYFTETGTAAVVRNPYTEITPEDEADDAVSFRYRRAPGTEGPFGFKVEGGVIKTLVGGAWQDLTDGNVMNVTRFEVAPAPGFPQETQLPCPRLCADGTQDCWPSLVVRSYVIDIAAQSTSDAAVQRSIRSQVRVRNDWLRFNDAANPNQVCPP